MRTLYLKLMLYSHGRFCHQNIMLDRPKHLYIGFHQSYINCTKAYMALYLIILIQNVAIHLYNTPNICSLNVIMSWLFFKVFSHTKDRNCFLGQICLVCLWARICNRLLDFWLAAALNQPSLLSKCLLNETSKDLILQTSTSACIGS